ncbi:MAG: hypothetical protein K5877_04535 [Lachnospiraceae bacterium]|nr:hypothetical protein [Lachnospiraceae bacterium]
MGKGNDEQLYQWKQEQIQGQVYQQEQDAQSYSQRAEKLLKGNYQYSDDGALKDAKRTTKKSGYMNKVIESVKALDECMSREIPTLLLKSGMEEILSACKRALKACEKYLLNRNPWTAEGKARKQMVQDFYAQVQMEYRQFKQVKLENLGIESDRVTGVQILKELRTPVYRDEEGTSITMEEKESRLTCVIEKENIKRSFRRSGDDTDNWDNVIKVQTNNLMTDMEHAQKNNDEEMKKRCTTKMKLLKALQNTIKSTYGLGRRASEKIMAEKDVYEMLGKLIDNGREQKIIGTMALAGALQEYKSATDRIKDIEIEIESAENDYKPKKEYLDLLEGNYAPFKKAEKYDKDYEKRIKDQLKRTNEAKESLERKQKKLVDYLSEYNNKSKETELPFILETLASIHSYLSSMKQNDKAKNLAKIGKNEDLAKRNVAASRLAEILGMENVISKSEFARVEVDGENMQGVLQEEVKGENLNAMKNIDDDDTVYRNKPGLKEFTKRKLLLNLTSIQIFDLICGQVDRSIDSYRVRIPEIDTSVRGVTDAELEVGITGVNNEYSFGELTYKDIQETKDKGHGSLQNIMVDGQWTIPAIDSALAERIMQLEPEMLDHKMLDLLTIEERKCLIDRFSAVKKMISDRWNGEKKSSDNSSDPSDIKFVSKTQSLGWNSDRIYDDYLEKFLKKYN